MENPARESNRDGVPTARTAPPPGPYEPFMLVLCVFVLMALAAETFFHLSDETKKILNVVDTGVCVIFLGDFVRDLIRAEDRLGYMRWGWIDLLSSIPMVDAFRIGRLARIVRLFRVLRGVRSTKALVGFVIARRAQSAFLAASLISILVLFFSSIAILQVEQEPGSNIQSPEDALWWAFVTITTVGYGDKFPVTTEGRLIAAGLMTAGVGLFGTFTGFVASWFVEVEEKKIEGELEDVRGELREIRRLLDQWVSAQPPNGALQMALIDATQTPAVVLDVSLPSDQQAGNASSSGSTSR